MAALGPDALRRAIPLHALAQAASIVGASMLACPFELALVRMQGDAVLPPAQRRGYRSVQDALWRVSSQEGVRVLWSGLAATTLRAALQAVSGCASCACAARARSVYARPSALPARVLAGVLPSLCRLLGLLLWLPIDAVKSRQQHQLTPLSTRRPGAVAHALREIFSHAPSALFRGLAAAAAYGEVMALVQALLARATDGQRKGLGD